MADLRFRFLLPDYDVFIAFSTGDDYCVRWLTAAFGEAGISSFCYHDLAPGDDWTVILPEAARRSRRVVAIVSSHNNGDRYFEHQFAEAKRRNILIEISPSTIMSQSARELAARVKENLGVVNREILHIDLSKKLVMTFINTHVWSIQMGLIENKPLLLHMLAPDVMKRWVDYIASELPVRAHRWVPPSLANTGRHKYQFVMPFHGGELTFVLVEPPCATWEEATAQSDWLQFDFAQMQGKEGHPNQPTGIQGAQHE